MFEVPAITDEDISWVCQVMGLPETAFHGDGTDERAEVLKCNETIDVEACPGSGKTTLLVAKLAILSRKWTDKRRGICVLSHTNVARLEIEKRLGATQEGQRLLRFPHFIGTIHGFINEFLALPFLRSYGISTEVIDTEIALNRRWKNLPYYAKAFLENNRSPLRALQYVNIDFNPPVIRAGKGCLGENSRTYKAIKKVCKDSLDEGYHCYDELFIWANELLSSSDNTCDDLKHRFPVVFLDEVQDTDETQAAILHKIFMAGSNTIQRQRFGDSNQAIFGESSPGASASDPFPDTSVRRDIRRSFRFPQPIADLAEPLAFYPQGLIGAGAISTTAKADPTNVIFLFDHDSIMKVIPEFANFLSANLSEEDITDGLFAAVGAVHKESDDNEKYRVGHYWPDYSTSVNNRDSTARSFVRHLQYGRGQSVEQASSAPAVGALATAIVRALRLSGVKRINPTSYPHRQIIREIGENVSLRTFYLDMVQSLCLNRARLEKISWEIEHIRKITEFICRFGEIEELSEESEVFLSWPPDGGLDNSVLGPARPTNVYKHLETGLNVKIGSIHSVKGETHTATLVLDTFNKTFHLKALLPWLIGKNVGGTKAKNDQQKQRLRLHYVAMTRPSKALGLAMKADLVSDDQISILKDRGWAVAHVKNDGVVWF